MAREKDHRLAFHYDTHQIAGQVNLKISPHKHLHRLLAFDSHWWVIVRMHDRFGVETLTGGELCSPASGVILHLEEVII